ncbi:unnamed protein product [Rangifer tarandus platyrhynchus]|uniref:Uncharacterized protein n=1 Tax=Rangifer tarandus platyrhynchus TaxID=3082113 RepID=A0AC60A088_RANTA
MRASRGSLSLGRARPGLSEHKQAHLCDASPVHSQFSPSPPPILAAALGEQRKGGSQVLRAGPEQRRSAVCAGEGCALAVARRPGVCSAAPSRAGTRTRPAQEAGRPGGLAAPAPVAPLAPRCSSCRLETPSFPASQPGSWGALRPPPLVTPAPALSGRWGALVESHKPFCGRTVCLAFSP